MRIHVFGDSHAIACFARFTDADIYWLGPMTMYRVARDGVDFVDRYVPNSLPKDIFIFVFGEIDVRCHIGRIAALQKTPISDVISSICSRFLDHVAAASQMRAGRFVICSVVPPSELDSDPDFPTHGTIEERVLITRGLNQALLEGTRRRGLIFLNFSEKYADQVGRLRVNFSDGFVHVGVDHTRQIWSELVRVLGEPIRYRWDLWWLGIIRAPILLLLAYLRPRALWRFNREYGNTRTRSEYR